MMLKQVCHKILMQRNVLIYAMGGGGGDECALKLFHFGVWKVKMLNINCAIKMHQVATELGIKISPHRVN